MLAFPGDVNLPPLLENIAALPDIQGCMEIANEVLGRLKTYSSQLDPVQYSAIFTVLNEAVTELAQ